MSFEFAPLSNFIQSSDRTPMTVKEYKATMRPQSFSVPTLGSKPAEDSVDIFSQKDQVKEYMRDLTSQLNAYSASTLIGSIGSKSFGASRGLYSGVGQMPTSQMQSLIRKYA